MKVIKATGLVPVKAIVRFQHNRSGTVFGVTPEVARTALKAKEVELFPIPEGIDTIDVADLIPSTKEKADVAEAELPGEVVIPDDWETMQWLKRIKLAEAITGDKLQPVGDEKPLDVAMRVIAEEVQRRAAAGPKTGE